LKDLFNEDTPWHLWQPSIGTSDIDTRRITPQQSVFLFGAPEVPQSFIKKEILISGEHKNNLLRELKIMGISEQTLFSDLAGFFERNNVDSVYDKELAEDFYTSQIEKSRKEGDNVALTNNYSQRGIFRSALGKYEGAIEDFNEAIKISPQYAGAYNNRGLAKIELGKYKEAIEDYDNAIEINPQYTIAYNNRGNAKTKLGQYKEAIEDFDKAIGIDPQFAVAYASRGLTKTKLGRYEEAIEDYDEATKINPHLAHAYYYRGIILLFLSEWESAKTDLITAKNHGVDIAKLFQEVYRNVTEFEKKFNVPLPTDIKALLNYKNRD